MRTEIACVIDRSGSMNDIRSDAIGGFNAFLRDQKSVAGECKLTLVLFNHEYSIVHDGVNLQDVPELTEQTYVPSGTTALLDAVGRTVDTIGGRLDKQADKPKKVIVVILTDGMENASKDYTRSRVAEMIKHQQEKYSWEFIFLAANQDAFSVGGALNIKTANTVPFAANSAGTKAVYASASTITRGYRS